MKVPFFDLKRQHSQIETRVNAALREVMESQVYILGSKVKALEDAFRSFLDVEEAIGVASGSDAILLSLMALGLREGDEVVTTPFSFFATVSSIVRLGARPVFADISEHDFSIDPDEVGRKITKKTKVILPVHLFGQCADMPAILSLAEENEISVMEDAAQAIGARWDGRAAGSLGRVAAFSFYPTKNLGGCGDGGMITTKDTSLGKKIRLLRNHGASPKYFHPLMGINSRLDEIQAAFLLVKMPLLEEWNGKRRALAERYRSLFREKTLEEAVTLPAEKKRSYHTFHQFVVRVSRRDALRDFLGHKGIGTEIYYPLPLHLQECFRFLGYKDGDFPVAERAAQEVLALPIFPELTVEEQERVVEGIAEFYQKL